MTAIILEDESVAKDRLVRQILELNTGIEIIEAFESVQELAAYLLNNDPPDLLFLDINVSDGSSFELFDVVEVKSQVIFTTAYSEYAIEAFKKNALHYLMKPIKILELKEAIQRASQLKKSVQKSLQKSIQNTVDGNTYSNRFLIKFGPRLYNVNVEDIAYVYSHNKISYFVKHDGNRVASDYKLQSLEVKLNPGRFFRANRQFIISRQCVEKIFISSRSRLEIRLKPKHSGKILISTQRVPIFKSWLKSEQV